MLGMPCPRVHNAADARFRALLMAFSMSAIVFSTTNACFKHPNGAAVARVIVGSNEPALWLNHETSPSRQWECPN